MADSDDGWASPSGAGPRQPAYGPQPPRYGERVPGWTPPAPQQTPPAAPTGYVPPPRRGLIPLHPLSFGQLLGSSFAVIRWNPRASVVPALIVSILQTALTLALFTFIGISAFDRISRASQADQGAIIAGSVLEAVLGGLLVFAITVFASSLLQGMLVSVVADGALGKRPTFGQVLRAAGRRIWPLAAVAALFAALQLVAIGLLAGLAVALLAIGNTAGIVGGVVTAILGSLGYLVLYAWLFVKLATVPSVIVLEGLGPFRAIARSWKLLRGSFWRTFGLLALVIVMVSAASQLVSLPFSLIGGALGGVLFPNGTSSDDPSAVLLPTVIASLPASVVAAVIAGIGQVAQISAVVLVYLDTRMRREGLDLDLQRSVEEGTAAPYPTSSP